MKIFIFDPLPTESIPLTVETSDTTEPKVTAPVPFRVRLLKFEVPLMVWAPPPNITVPEISLNPDIPFKLVQLPLTVSEYAPLNEIVAPELMVMFRQTAAGSAPDITG